MNVSLRPVEDRDLDAIFDLTSDPESVRMAAFTAGDQTDRGAFLERMARLRADPSLWNRVIVVDGAVAGTIGSFLVDGEREVTYWVDRRFWGKGVASAALGILLAEIDERPMFARAASDNAGSLRVLEKAGFRRIGVDRGFAPGRGEEIEETILRLDEQSAVPDVLAPDLACVFCGINPGRVSAAAAAHFANPRNDFWRLLHDAGFTPRLYEPNEQFDLLALGWGVTNAAYRTTPGSGDLRRADFDPARLTAIARDLRPRVLAFVGKEAYRGLFGERPELGAQLRSLGSTALFVLPSTSPANATVPYAERLRWFRALRAFVEPEERRAVRGLVLDADGRVLLVRFEHPVTRDVWWATVGGGVDPGESDEEALRRELREEAGLERFEIGPLVHTREHTFPWDRRLIHQQERFHLVRIEAHEPVPTIDVAAEGVTDVRWWTQAELAEPPERVVPDDLLRIVRENDA